jgi:hypothetical protein
MRGNHRESAVAVDWQRTANDERKLLYRAIRESMDRTHADWPAIFRRAYGAAVALGDGYIDNFRAGRISRRRAQRLYDWLQSDHPDIAARLERDIRALYDAGPTDGPWEAFLAEHGQYGLIKVERAKADTSSRGRSRIEAARAPPRIDAELPLDTWFNLMIDSPVAGYVTGLQWIRGQWLYLPLSPHGTGVRLSGGSGPDAQFQPAAPETRFRETHEPGLHCLVLIVAPDAVGYAISGNLSSRHAIPDEKLEETISLLRTQDHDSWAVLRFNAMFIEDMKDKG